MPVDREPDRLAYGFLTETKVMVVVLSMPMILDFDSILTSMFGTSSAVQSLDSVSKPLALVLTVVHLVS